MSTSFNRAYESFRRRLTPDLSSKFEYATVDDLRDAIEEIQNAQAQRNGLRNLNKLKHFLHGLEQYAGVLEVFVQGPIKFCLQVASKTINAFDALLDAYKKIGDSLPILSAVNGIFYSKPHVQQVLANVYEDILDFHKRSVVFFGQGAWRLTLKLVHHTLDDMFGEVLKNLERSKNLLMDAANVAHFQDAQQERLFWETDYQERIERDQKTRTRVVVEWLSADNSHIDQQEALREIRRDLPQSGTWIYKHSPFKDWLQEDKGKSLVFWLTGIPGAGKTVLFSSVIDQIHKSSETIHFYCKAGEPHQSTFNAIARSLISQLFQKDTGFLEYVYDAIIASKECRPSNSVLLKQILEALVSCRSSLVIAIDGIDECEEYERSKILSFVSDVSKQCSPEQNFKFFLTSRREEDIRLSLHSAFTLNIEPEYVEGDIRAYVKLQTAKLSRKFEFDKAKEWEIAKEVLTRPEGMFLLARLIMENLLVQDTILELEEELKSDILPNGIDEAYGRLLVRIGKGRSGKIGPEKSRHRAALILSILATAKRPLTVNEIQGAISISLTDRTVDLNGRRLRGSFAELCGPIVESRVNGAIELIHPTAKAYLLQNHSGPYMNSSDAEFKMAILCVSYLTFDCFCSETSQQGLEQYSSNGSYAFQQYAVCNWIQHVQSLKDCWELLGNSDCILVYNACRVLLQRDLPRQSFEILPASKLAKPPYTALNKALCSLHDEYERVGSISDNDIPPAMQRMHQVRTAVEHLFSTSTNLPTSRLLTDSYGPLLFKCPILKCPSFQQGFATQSARDNHYKVHEPPFTCPHKGCEYAILGFLAEHTLKTHLRLCHGPIPDQFTFPKVKPRSVEYALNNAIDRDDITAINHLATELSSMIDRKTGFLLRAIQKGSQQAVVLISRILGTEAEFTHTVKGRTAVSEAAKKGYAEVLKIFLNGCETLSVRDAQSQIALLEATSNGHEVVGRLLLDDVVDANVKTKTGETALHVAASFGHEVMIRLLLERGADIAAKNKKGQTALHMAASKGHAAVVHLLLLNSSVDVMAKDYGELTALHVAALSGHQAVARQLLDRGAGTEAKNRNGETALHLAIRNGYEAVAQLLLEEGAGIEAKDKNGKTALEQAAETGHETVARLLLDKGAKSEGKDENGKTALHKAVSYGHEVIVRLLLDRNADVTAEDNDGSTALQLAAVTGHETIARLLLDKGANSEGKNKNGKTALHKAASLGHEAVVRLLLDRNADVTAEDNDGSTALQLAAETGHETIAWLLLDNGANSKGKDKNGKTAIHKAASHGHEMVVRLLLDRNADVTAEDNDGSTALQLAAETGHETIAWLLLDNGANSEGKDKNGKTAIHKAASHGHEMVVRLLLHRNADVTAEDNDGKTALEQAAETGHETVARLLLDKGAKSEGKDENGKTALHKAVSYGHEVIVRLLLDRNADVTAEDNDGSTALQLAAENGHETIARLLLDNGANSEGKDKNGKTAIHKAASHGHEAVVRLLIDGGADVAATDNIGLTALHIAAETRCEKLVRLLLSRGAEVRVIDSCGRTTLHYAMNVKAIVDSISESYPRIKHNSALQDYQVQLMILERQNKQRLLKAREEAQMKHVPTVEEIERVMHLLLEGGVDIAAKDNEGISALHIAADLGSATLVRLLLDWEADITAKTQNGKTALHMAACNGYETVVQVLLDRGADIAAQDSDGLTALQHATKKRQKGNPTAQLLQSVTQAKYSQALYG